MNLRYSEKDNWLNSAHKKNLSYFQFSYILMYTLITRIATQSELIEDSLK